MWYLPFTKSPRKPTVTYHFSDLQEVYSDNPQIHTKCQLQYFHPPHISTSGKCHCVIIHQTTKATEYIGRERERNVLFNDALNTFYLRLYGVRHMVKDHSDSEKGNPLPPHRLLFPISSKGSFICTIPQTG